MKVAYSDGGLGDTVYSIPVMRALSVTHYHITAAYAPVYDLVASQGFTLLPEPVDGMLDVGDFRKIRNRSHVHIIRCIARAHKVKLANWSAPFLFGIPAALDAPDNIIQLTPRWRDASRVNWKAVLYGLTGSVGFVGLQHEWVDFCTRYGSIPWINTRDIYEMATYIQGAQKFYGNQSVGLTLAQGLGKTYYLEKKPHKSNTLFLTPNENLL